MSDRDLRSVGLAEKGRKKPLLKYSSPFLFLFFFFSVVCVRKAGDYGEGWRTEAENAAVLS